MSHFIGGKNNKYGHILFDVYRFTGICVSLYISGIAKFFVAFPKICNNSDASAAVKSCRSPQNTASELRYGNRAVTNHSAWQTVQSFCPPYGRR